MSRAERPSLKLDPAPTVDESSVESPVSPALSFDSWTSDESTSPVAAEFLRDSIQHSRRCSLQPKQDEPDDAMETISAWARANPRRPLSTIVEVSERGSIVRTSFVGQRDDYFGSWEPNRGSSHLFGSTSIRRPSHKRQSSANRKRQPPPPKPVTLPDSDLPPLPEAPERRRKGSLWGRFAKAVKRSATRCFEVRAREPKPASLLYRPVCDAAGFKLHYKLALELADGCEAPDAVELAKIRRGLNLSVNVKGIDTVTIGPLKEQRRGSVGLSTDINGRKTVVIAGVFQDISRAEVTVHGNSGQ